MEIAALNIPLNQGILKASIEKKINGLFLIIEIYTIKFPSEEMIPILMNSLVEQCNKNPDNINGIFNTLSTQLIIKKEMTLSEVETFIDNLKLLILNIKENETHKIIIFDNKSINIYIPYLKRLERFISSFLNNFSLINGIINLIGNNKINEIKNNNSIEEKKELIFENKDNIKEEKQPEILQTEEKTTLDEILEFLLISPQLIGYLIHLIDNYYMCYDGGSVKITDDSIEINSTPIFPQIPSYNKTYILILINSLKQISLSKINLVIKNILKYIENENDKFNNLEIKCLLYILFLFCIRHINETTDFKWITENIDKVIFDTKTQQKLLNTYCRKILNTKIKFKINSELGEFKDNENNLDVLSKKYSYLKSIDQEEFAEKVFSELKEEKNNYINISYKNIIDINDLLLNNEIGKNEFVNLKNKTSSFLSYKQNIKNKKIITELFNYFLNYIQNPVSVKLIPKEFKYYHIINYFDILSKILIDSNLKKENIRTIEYYKLLLDNLSKDTTYPIYLIIIFQIIIPYYYYYYNITMFEDSLLSLIKI